MRYMTNRRAFPPLIILPLLLIVGIATAISFYLPIEWQNIPLHAVMETTGAMAALGMATLLLLSDTREHHYRVDIASGLIAMGILDLFHALADPGGAFVWLHSLGTLLGGAFFAKSCLFPRIHVTRSRFLLPLVVVFTTATLGLLIFSIPNLLPAALEKQVFTPSTQVVNILGGLLFLTSARRFNAFFHLSRNPEDGLFAILALIFGIAGLTFSYSEIWNITWWAWHLLRLLAYLLAVHFVARTLLEWFEAIHGNEKQIRSVLNNLSSGIATVDPSGKILSCNPALEKNFGYLSGKLVGHNITRLMAHDRDWCTGLRQDGSTFPMNIEAGEIMLEGSPIFILEISDLTTQKTTEQYLSHLAQHDALTKLPNRLLFEDRLSQAIAQAHRHSTMVGIMFVDLDNFKQINDTMGHQVGDQLLRVVAERLTYCVREGDTVARFGGDEFVLIILDVGRAEDCLAVAEKISEQMSVPFHFSDRALHATASIGISLYPLHGENLENLVRHADMAMYQAKLRGRNTYSLYFKECLPATEADCPN